MIESFPVFEYRLAGKDDALCPEGKFWNMLLCGNNNLPGEKLLFTIADYLLSAKKFLEENQYLVFKKSLKAVLARSVEISEVKKVLISLEKHGPFYHPIKVTAILQDNKSAYFVLNGAVSNMGLAVIENEYLNLKELYRETLNPDNLNPGGFVPEVFGVGFVESEKGKIGFFLAQWFDKFEEFHVVRANNKNKIGILNKDGSFSLISDSESFRLFKKASEILTFYYNINSFKQIFPWHHAAGDFVVRIDKNEMYVKLVTVRGYGRLMETDADNPMIDLLFFFLNLTLRMRIDRNKGTEEYVFLDEMVVQASFDGFIKGLRENFKRNNKSKKMNSEFYNIFIEFIKEFDYSNILNLFIMIAGSYSKDVPEASIIEKNLEAHAKAVLETIRKV
ncbi:MAG: hypothetical protein KAJ62_09050 [Desulfobacteraceae bacterium]|nr:hypothetical protein [Desulfobacteraceae bacterium]